MLIPITTVARDADSTDLTDLTTARRTGPAQWTASGLEVPFDRDLTSDEVAAVAARLLSADSTEELQRAALTAYLTNRAPTEADTVAQLKVLTVLALRLMDGPRIEAP